MSENIFNFNPTRFYLGNESDAAEYYLNVENKQFVNHLRNIHPELSSWSDAAIDCAWGDYSRDIFAVGHVSWITERDVAFLAYCYISQLNPDFCWGGTGLYMDDVEELGELLPWLLSVTEEVKKKYYYWSFHQ